MTEYYQKIRSVDIQKVAEYLGIAVTKWNKAICPFHDDKDPSLSFKNNRYRCFGCGSKGSTIDLVMEVLKMDIPNAAAWIASRFGIPIPDRKNSRPFAFTTQKVSPTLPSPAAAGKSSGGVKVETQYFEVYETFMSLLAENSGEKWVKQRGFPEGLAVTYSIRSIYSPTLVVAALREKFSEDILLSSGVLAVPKDKGAPYLNWGTGWIMLPIRGVGENEGRIVFLQGRNPLPEGKPRFKEISGGFQRPLFWTNAAKEIPEGEDLILVEGIPDALAAEYLGYPAVAILGVEALSDAIIRSLLPWRIKLAADMDSAGRIFSVAAAERFEEMGRFATIMELPSDAKDWNDLLKQTLNIC